MARVITAFNGVPDGQIYPKTFSEGDTVTGDLAVVAVAEGWAIDEDAKPKSKASKADKPAAAAAPAAAATPAGDA